MITDLLLVAVSVAVGVVGEAWLPEPLRAFEEARAEANLTPNDWVVLGAGIPLIIVALVSSVGLMFFWRPARPLYLASLIVAIMLTPLGGPYITSGLEEALDCVSMTVSGVILALIYFSPLRDFFKRQQNAP